MPETVAAQVTLSDVERELASRHRSLAFAPAIEQTFEAKTRSDRFRDLVSMAIVAIVLYDLFLVNDWLVLHDRFREMVIARLCIFTPGTLILLAIAQHLRSKIALEWFSAGSGLLAVFLPMSVMVFSDSTHKLSYQYGSVLVMIFSTLIQRVRFRPAFVAVVGMLVIQLTATYVSKAFDIETYISIVTFFGTAAILQLMALYVMESADRRTFLFALRGSLLQDQLQLSAQTDALTGLFNRRHLADVLAEMWTRTEPAPVSAILLDIDHFKLFNDSYGHLQGDECLRTVGACLLHATGKSGASAYRFGGEEMLVLLPGVDPSEAGRLAEEIRRTLAAKAIPHLALGEDARVTASFGVAGVIAPETSASDLIAAADTALYAAKRAGRNCVWPPVPQNVAAGEPSQPALVAKCA